MKLEFLLVEVGCFMYENTDGRWIIEHPRNDYFPTKSKMWDVLIEYPSEPHNKPLKFMGSFKAKSDALELR